MATPRRSAPKVAPINEASHHSIAIRAYDLFVQRGRTHGWDLDDWLQAERESASKPNGKAPARKRPKSKAVA